MQRFSRLVLLVVASFTFVVGVAGAILFFPEDSVQPSQAKDASPQVTLTWQTSLAQGQTQAKDEHKYVLADVYTDWCGWCKRLDRDVFTNAKLVHYLQNGFICVKVNAEDPKEGKAVADLHKVTGYPCALVFSPDGKLIGRIEGYQAARAYMSTLKGITSGAIKASESPDQP
jgi:thiol:disulfide interchange protein